MESKNNKSEASDPMFTRRPVTRPPETQEEKAARVQMENRLRQVQERQKPYFRRNPGDLPFHTHQERITMNLSPGAENE
jgi:hypothetical protein